VAPAITNAFAGVDLGSQLDVFADGWAGFFDLLDTAIDNQVLRAKIPLIGDQLRDAARFVGNLRDKVVDNLETAGAKTLSFVRQRLYEAVGPGLKWLQDSNGDGLVTPAT